MAEENPPSTLAEQLAKILPPAVIDRLGELAPEAQAQLEKVVPILSKINVTRATDYKNIYSNIFRTRIGTSEVTLLFARQTHTPSILASADSVEEECEVTMGWPQIKMLLMTLSDVISSYEAEIGVIGIPAAFQPNTAGWRPAVRNLGIPSAPSRDASIATGSVPVRRQRRPRLKS
jgi:hypothetical protein